MAEVKKPGYPGRYSGAQTLWLTALGVLVILSVLTGLYREAIFLGIAIASFYISRFGLIDRPKEEKKP